MMPYSLHCQTSAVMINMGTHEVFVDEEDDWTVVTEDELPSAQWEHTFVMTENGLEILTY